MFCRFLYKFLYKFANRSGSETNRSRTTEEKKLCDARRSAHARKNVAPPTQHLPGSLHRPTARAFQATSPTSLTVRALDGLEQSNGNASEGCSLAHGRTQSFVPLGSPHDGDTSTAEEFNIDAKMDRIHLLDRLLLLSAQELGSSSPSMMLALSPPTLLRPADCRLWLHKWMAWRPSAQAQQLRCAHACSNARVRVRVPCKRAAHLHACEKALGPAAACARERCRN